MSAYWKVQPGLNAVGAYQVSGAPFASGSIVCGADDLVPYKVAFPYVTRWIYIINQSNDEPCKVAFSKNGLDGTNYFTLPDKGGLDPAIHQIGVLEVKVSEIWLTGSSKVDVIAGLTSINAHSTSGSMGPSWSGSIGVG